MKAVILLAILFASVSANSQTKLKDLLYGGKLKLDSGSVIRKDDDLSTKIDTSTKKPVEQPKAVVIDAATPDLGTNGLPVLPDTSTALKDPTTAPKVNNKSWKEFIDELTTSLRTEVLPNKKIKDGTYNILLEYEIDVDGQVRATNVASDPSNTFLEQQIKERITLSAPKMEPLMGTNGKPRKAQKRQTITVTK
jgi:hypothetical protein